MNEKIDCFVDNNQIENRSKI